MRTFAFLLFVATSAPGLALAEQEWIKASTPNFELYTTAGEGTARRALLHFEQLRTFFLQARGLESKSDRPIRIIGFRNRKEYEPYKPNETASAFYLSWNDQDAIVIGDLRDENRRTAIHEYVHLLVRNSELKLPIWLNEGFADLYSTLMPIGDEVQVGALLPGRFHLLKQGGWLPMETVLTVNHDSPEYNAKRHSGKLYSQSWALTHMLNMHEDYRDKFTDLVSHLHGGSSSIGAFEKVYGLSPQQLEKALKSYMNGDRFFGVLFDVKLEKSSLEPSIEQASGIESGLILAQLLGATRGKQDQAKQAYAELAAAYPEDARIAEALGYLAWRGGDRDTAREHFIVAAEHGSQNPKMYYALASFSRGSAEPEQIIGYLIQCLKYDPGDAAARRQVGFLHLQQKQWIQALLHFNQIKQVKEAEDAFHVYRGKAYAYYQIDRFEDAGQAAELAKQHAQSPTQTENVERLIQAVNYKTIANDEAAKIETAKAQGATTPVTFDTANLERDIESRNLGRDPEDPAPPRLRRRERVNPNPSEDLEELTYGPTAESFTGRLLTFECQETAALLHIEAEGGETRVFAILDPNNIVVQGAGGAAEFTCGPQVSKPIRVEYDDGVGAALGADGAVRLIDFLEL